MAQLSLLPNYIMRQFNNDGRLLSGGKIYFYQAGTNTPKAVFKDSTGTIPHTNPVILDASGSEIIFLGQGAYRIKITDQNDVQIDSPVDGVFGNGSGGVNSESTVNATLLLNYNELRSLITTPDVVYVAGRTTEGDGGQGWFQYIPTSTEIDDDSIILTAQSGSKVYRRIFDGVIDPRWAGLTYNVSIDQATYFNKNSLLSVKYGLPVLYTASTYINQNVSAIDNSTIQMADTGYFISTIGINMVFNSGSVFIGSDRVFGQSVQPKFANNVVSEIKLSWMAGNTDDERITKWINSSIATTPLLLDENATVGSSFNFTSPLQPVPGCSITFTSATPSLSLTVSKILPTDYPYKIFDIKTSTITALTFTDKVLPEWFGALGNGVNDTIALKQAFQTGNIYLSNAKTYVATSALSLNAPGQVLNISGPGTIDIGPSQLTGSFLGIEDSTVIANVGNTNESQSRTIATNSFVGTFTFTNPNSAWPNSPSVGSKYIVSGSSIVLTCTSATTPDKLVTDMYEKNQFVGSKMICVYDANPTPWVTVGTFVSINSSHPSNIEATNKSINGAYLTNTGELGAYEIPYLRNAVLPFIPNASSLATTSAGIIFDIGRRYEFINNVDYTIVADNAAWTGGISIPHVVITPFTQYTGMLSISVIFKQGGVPPVSPTNLYAGFTITPLTPRMKYWLDNGYCNGNLGQVDLLLRYDGVSNYTCNCPTAVWRAGSYSWTFCSNKGIGGTYYSSLYTPNPWMGWGDIWPAETYARPAQITYEIGFSQIISHRESTFM